MARLLLWLHNEIVASLPALPPDVVESSGGFAGFEPAGCIWRSGRCAARRCASRDPNRSRDRPADRQRRDREFRGGFLRRRVRDSFSGGHRPGDADLCRQGGTLRHHDPLSLASERLFVRGERAGAFREVRRFEGRLCRTTYGQGGIARGRKHHRDSRRLERLRDRPRGSYSSGRAPDPAETGGDLVRPSEHAGDPGIDGLPCGAIWQPHSLRRHCGPRC